MGFSTLICSFASTYIPAGTPIYATLRRHYSNWRLGLKPHLALIDSRESPLSVISEIN